MTDGVIKQYELYRTREVILDCVSSFITDPFTGKEKRISTTHWIFDGFPNPADVGKPAPQGWKFPIIIIAYPEDKMDLITLDGTKHKIEHNVEITCYSRTRDELNQLADQVAYIIQTTAHSWLKQAAVYGGDIVGSVNGDGFVAGQKYYSKARVFNFTRFD